MHRIRARLCSAARESATDSLPHDVESLRALALKAIAERDVAIAERDAERAEKVKLEAERDRLQSLRPAPRRAPSSPLHVLQSQHRARQGGEAVNRLVVCRESVMVRPSIG